MSTIVIGVGSAMRGDDGFGEAVLDTLRGQLRPEDDVVLARCDGEPARLIDLWDGFSHAIVVDAARGGTERYGHLYNRELIADGGHATSPAPGHTGPGGNSHAAGLGTAVQLADALGRLPARLTLLAVNGKNFDIGAPLSRPVAEAVPVVVRCIRRDLLRAQGRRIRAAPRDQSPARTVPADPTKQD